MNRGILILTKEEVNELLNYIQLDKLVIASENITEENRVFLNEDELETILDEIGTISGSEIISTVKEKISNLLFSFR